MITFSKSLLAKELSKTFNQPLIGLFMFLKHCSLMNSHFLNVGLKISADAPKIICYDTHSFGSSKPKDFLDIEVSGHSTIQEFFSGPSYNFLVRAAFNEKKRELKLELE